MSLAGANDGIFFCFHSSCQLGLNQLALPNFVMKLPCDVKLSKIRSQCQWAVISSIGHIDISTFVFQFFNDFHIILAIYCSIVFIMTTPDGFKNRGFQVPGFNVNISTLIYKNQGDVARCGIQSLLTI